MLACIRTATVLVPTLAALAGMAFSHDDDLKLLDHQPPVVARGHSLASLPGGTGGWLGGGGSNTVYDSQGVTLLSWIPLAQLGGATNSSDCWGYTSPSGREYAIIGVSNGTTYVEITNPVAPVVLQHIAGPMSGWRGVKVWQDRAYVVSEGGGSIQVVSLTNIDAGL